MGDGAFQLSFRTLDTTVPLNSPYFFVCTLQSSRAFLKTSIAHSFEILRRMWYEMGKSKVSQSCGRDFLPHGPTIECHATGG